MMKVVVTTDGGRVIEYENVIDYGIIDKDEVEQACDSADVKCTQEVLDEVKRWCGHSENLPTYDELIECVSQFREV